MTYTRIYIRKLELSLCVWLMWIQQYTSILKRLIAIDLSTD